MAGSRLAASLTGLGFLIGVSAGGAEVYKPDRNHSTIGFAVPILGGLSEVHGKFADFSLTLSHEPDDLSKFSVRLAIKAASIDTGITDRDEHLRSRDFFDVTNFPEIVFQSTKIRKTEAGYVVDGTLEMHGRKQPIAVPLRVTGEFTRDGRTSTGLAGTLTLKRSDYGINWKH